jgi:hypothetical protein
MFDLGVLQGDVGIHISKPGGHPPEFWAEQACKRIMSVANTAPQPIRDQAIAFKDQLKLIVLQSIRSALQEQRVYDTLKVEAVSRDAADTIRRS